MILISAIGNGDIQYNDTRHNAGYFGLDVLRQLVRYEGFTTFISFNYDKKLLSDILRIRWGGEDVLILQKTLGYMNEAGKYVKRVFNTEKIDHFILFHDDLDLKLGEYKIQKGKSPHGHNGVKSVEEELGYKDFYRVRIGIDNREGNEIPGEEYVLQRFTKEEKLLLNSTLLRACEELLLIDIFEQWI